MGTQTSVSRENSPSSGKTGRRSPSKIVRLAWMISGFILVAVLLVLLARWLRSTPFGENFIATFPGHSELPDGAPVGFPVWLNWQHFLNAFFIVLIIRSGWRVRTVAKPAAYWTPKTTGWLRSKNSPQKISLDLWFHLTLDFLWLLNGIVFIVLLFVTGQWIRIVPTNVDIFPNALSAGLQYLSLNWPTENGWVNYNALQVLSYFTVVFIAAPLAILTGFRMSALWPNRAKKLNQVYPIELARAIHFPVMIFFVAFVVIHVILVLSTGALRNLNHMYAANDSDSWLGFWLFVLSVLVMAGAWIAARPLLLRPIASLMGKVSR